MYVLCALDAFAMAVVPSVEPVERNRWRSPILLETGRWELEHHGHMRSMTSRRMVFQLASFAMCDSSVLTPGEEVWNSLSAQGTPNSSCLRTRGLKRALLYGEQVALVGSCARVFDQSCSWGRSGHGI